MTREQAQRRANQIAAFRAEVAQLAREDGPSLDAAQLAAVLAHQDALLTGLAREFDVDRTAAARQMSRGMQAASILGAAALVAAIVSFFYRIWGSLTTPAQVALLVTAPVASVAATIVAGRIEKTRYVASLCAIVACGAFVLETVALARMFNLRESAHLLAFWAAFALALSVPWRFAIPWALGTATLAVYAGVAGMEFAGFPWTQGLEHPEPVMLAGIALLPLARRAPGELVAVGRSVLLVVALLPLLLLSSIDGMSLVPADTGVMRVIYQVAAFAAAFLVTAWGVRRQQPATLLIGSIFAGLVIVTRFADWWWDWMPKYLFFLIMAAVAIGWLWALRVARRRLERTA